MKLPFVRRRQRVSRGQAMVEFALILPILVLLLLLAVDFGRVFFGWVAINNASRIAANEAAFHPEAWEGSGNAQLKLIYREQVSRTCSRSTVSRPAAVPGRRPISRIPPTSTCPGRRPRTSTSSVTTSGSTLTCGFGFLTPLLGNFMGNPMPIAAASEFGVKGGEINGIPVGGAPPGGCLDKTVPNLVGTSVAAARAAWTASGFTGAFTPASGQDTETVTAQNTTPTSNPSDCLVATAVVTVTTSGPPGCSSPDITVPNMVGMTVSSAPIDVVRGGFQQQHLLAEQRVRL